MKKKASLIDAGALLTIIFAGIIIGGMYLAYDNFIVNGSINGKEGPWSNQNVYYKLNTFDKYSGADESATCKVFTTKPSDWLNPRGDFSDAELYTSYTASSGIVTVNKQYPGKHYAVCTVSGSNTEFIEFDIPDGKGLLIKDLNDYNSAPESKNVEISAVGSTTDADFAFTLVNGTSVTVTDTVTLTVASSTEFRGWKVVVTDTEGFTTDADNDGTYDEGIKVLELTVCGVKKNVFEPARGIDEFNSEDKYTFNIDNCKVDDGDSITLKASITANTGDYTGANDEIWGEGEGVLGYVYIYDNEGNLFSTSDITA